MLKALEKKGYGYPTTIQAEAIPHFMQWKDVIAKAPTGTGKTFAFGIPMIEHIDPELLEVQGLILAPTRELAIQICDELRGLLRYYKNIRVAVVYGGQKMEPQIKALKAKPQIVVATPGRLMDHYNRKNLRLDKIHTVVLDEADRMLDMGFYDDIMAVVGKLPKDRQTIMFSATMPANIRKMAKAIMNDPAEVQIAISRPPESIKQQAADLYEPQKSEYLKLLLKERVLKKVIVFVGKKQRVKDLARALRALNIDARAMHSDLEQKERDEVMLDFRNGKVDVLVATDIVSRGIDVDDVPLVINYDVPRDAEDYVHRIGRTARAENKGEAITLVSPEDKRFFNKIERFLQKVIDRVPLPDELGAAPDSSVCSLAADDRKPSSKHRKGGKPHWHNRKPKHNRQASHKQ
jgi:superfamily II DNA/RNA helicase